MMGRVKEMGCDPYITLKTATLEYALSKVFRILGGERQERRGELADLREEHIVIVADGHHSQLRSGLKLHLQTLPFSVNIQNRCYCLDFLEQIVERYEFENFVGCTGTNAKCTPLGLEFIAMKVP